MWVRAHCRLPYHGDPDYRDSLVASIKGRFGRVPVDVTLLELCGSFDVGVGDQEASTLSGLPLVGAVRSAVDRDMIVPAARTIV